MLTQALSIRDMQRTSPSRETSLLLSSGCAISRKWRNTPQSACVDPPSVPFCEGLCGNTQAASHKFACVELSCHDAELLGQYQLVFGRLDWFLADSSCRRRLHVHRARSHHDNVVALRFCDVVVNLRTNDNCLPNESGTPSSMEIVCQKGVKEFAIQGAVSGASPRSCASHVSLVDRTRIACVPVCGRLGMRKRIPRS